MTRRYVALLAWILRLSWRHHPHATAGLLAARTAAALAAPAFALALREAVDGILAGRRGAAVAGAAAAAVLFAAMLYLRAVERILDIMLVDRIGALHLRPRIERMLARLPGLDHLEDTALLDRATVLRGSGWRLSGTAWASVAAAFHVLRLALLLALLAVVVSPWLLLLLAFAAAPLWTTERGQRLVARAETDTAEAYRLQRHLFNLATAPAGAKEVRVTGSGPELARRQRRAYAEAMRDRFRARFRAMLLTLAGWLLFTAGFGAGLLFVAQRAGTAGDLVLAIMVTAMLRDSLQDAVLGVGDTMSGRTLAGPLLWLQDYAAAARDPGDRPAPDTLRTGITLDRVSFAYPGTGRPALDGVTCDLAAGSVVAIVGEYGSGKTTLVKLLTRFYLPDAGRVLVDGADLTDLSSRAWRARCSAAFQDFGRFHIRFGETVGLGDLPRLHDDAAIRDAVRGADAVALVERLPEGLSTQLGREFDGVELSEGQWQKTALARASMRTDPLLFVLDEPTASLDAPSEQEIFARYMDRARALAGRTNAITVVVSHRFTTVTGADQILVLDKGRLVEQGTHDELMAAGGRYADLYSIQATAYSPTSSTR